ncbi:MAG TPA: ATP-binding cassette domain-containing protein [Candidatus Thermoplasmatota archaeon]|nr:ATP-binding cassette domain-containing protein [Candidatus Thermoplasmatota archaeon]
MTTTMNAIDVKHLSKIYKGEIKAVDDVSFNVKEGIIFGFLGPNGAGKSSTIKMLVTLTKITKGSAHIFNLDVAREPSKVRELIGYVPQELSADGSLTGYENLLLSAKLYGLEPEVRTERIRDILEIMDLTQRSNNLVSMYSGGMVRRLEIGQAMLHHPRLLFLDEPTIGLDPAGRKLVWEHIRKLNKEWNTTIFLTTHYMEEADELCDQIGIIDRGKICVIDSPESLKQMVGTGTVTACLDLGDHQKEGQEYLTSVAGELAVSILELSSGKWQFTVPDAVQNAPKVLQKLNEHHITLKDLEIKSPTLEDAFLQITGTRLDEGSSKYNLKAVKRTRRTFKRFG